MKKMYEIERINRKDLPIFAIYRKVKTI